MSEIDQIESRILHVSNGPLARLILLNKAADEYNKHKVENSIYYQVCSIYGILQDKYLNILKDSPELALNVNKNLKKQKNSEESIQHENDLIKFVYEELQKTNDENFSTSSIMQSCNFLKDITDAKKGYHKIIEVCQSFPDEWTIIQLCKGPRPQTTYSVFKEIHERDADIYLTLLKHARSSEFPEPICIRLSDVLQVKLFKDFSKISAQCKEFMQVGAEDVITHEAKVKYWDNLKTLDKQIREVIVNLKVYIFPWIFLFRGIPSANTATGSKEFQKNAFANIDELCDSYDLKVRERVLLSLAALQILNLDHIEIEAISEEICSQKKAQLAIQQLLSKLQNDLTNPILTINDDIDRAKLEYKLTNFPCILIVDDQLDHFFWEELNFSQEMCRVNSLQCLWKLFDTYKHRIQKGYLTVDVRNGACVIDPDNTLPKTQNRMKAFCKYWLPSWPLKVGVKSTQEELFDDFFKRDCFLYCGHGSGLQHFSGRRISQVNIDAIVFLFGCDSTRMNSLGLYSDLIGTHFYYHAALCPSIVGTILPALDAKMDEFSVEIFSRWVSPDKKTFKGIPWDQINSMLWIKKGIIEQAAENKTKKKIGKDFENYHIGSLCGAITRIHARGEDKHYYNTVPYICRGLPVWNLNVQPLPK